MIDGLQITDYYELLALHSALMVARFSRNPIKPELPGSPYLADIANRIVQTLAEMEVERGHPERAERWYAKIDPTEELWQIAIRNASTKPDIWGKLSIKEKIERAKTFLSPFTITNNILDAFIAEVDENTINRE